MINEMMNVIFCIDKVIFCPKLMYISSFIHGFKVETGFFCFDFDGESTICGLLIENSLVSSKSHNSQLNHLWLFCFKN